MADALMMAIWRRGKPLALSHHSDQGSQGIQCSMNRAGEVWDNSAMESFFSSMTTERIVRKVDRTRDDVKADVFDCIERAHNPTRGHSTLRYVSPIEFEKAQRAQVGVDGTGIRPHW